MPRVLVIEDEARMASFVTRAISAHGLVVECAGDGVTGLRKILSGRYDLVILDLVLPSMDGMSVLREATLARPDLNVLVMSAMTDIQAKVECLDLGAEDYITKPFALAELLARVRARLRSRDTGREGDLRSGDLVLDVTRREARVGDRVVPLATREFLLLRHLLLRTGEVVPREELLARVWGVSFDPGSNVVDVCVRRLRGKLGDGLIETIRGVGYTVGSANAVPA
ncbi:MAG: response regulator transcription factor [Actinomycetota bacterium]